MKDLNELVTQTENIANIFHGMDKIEVAATQIIEQLPDMSEEQLEQLVVQAYGIEKLGWVIRGAAINEIQNRVGKRLKGGRGRKDCLRDGVGAAIAQMASRLGRSFDTLMKDAQIWRAWGKEILADADPLNREMYAVALRAGDKRDEAITLAHVKKDDPAYTVRCFTEDVRQLASGSKPEELEGIHWVNVGLKDREYEFVRAKAKEWKCSNAQVMSYYLEAPMKKAGNART